MAARKYASGTGAADRDDAEQVSHHSRIQTLILEAGKTKAMSFGLVVVLLKKNIIENLG